jgi:hypothetical protein
VTTPKHVSLRDKAKMLAPVLASYNELTELHELLADKCAAVERLLAAHHGAETVTEEQIGMCLTCAQLLTVKG